MDFDKHSNNRGHLPLRWCPQTFKATIRLLPARTASLYSDFRSQRTSNPEGYEANCKVWLKVFEGAARDQCLVSDTPGTQDRYIIRTGEGLSRSLASNRYGRPLALGAVVDYGISRNVLLPKQDFLKAKTSIHSKSSIPTPWQVESATAVTAAVDALVSSSATSVFTKDNFIDELAGVDALTKQISQDDWKILATYLSRDRQIITYDAASQTIKLRFGSETTAGPITQEDIDIASLRALIRTLQRQVNGLQTRVAEADQTARKAVSAKNNQAAKSALRSKKLAQNTLEQRTSTLQQLEEVFVKIEQAADQVEIVRVMEAAGRTLKSLNEKTGGAEKVHEVMDALKEQAMTTDEIGQALNEDSHNPIDEAEVDDELERLEKSYREAEIDREAAQKQAQLEREAEEMRLKLAALESPSKAIVTETLAKAETPAKHEAAIADT
ncbi:hypothetical protein AMS68_004457 [Peltaster fructicola]|uniref:SNF7 family protein n=1 Tax=Peltaster fructicola TaxID=286661 RepID=A0A6H0XWX9_9PEZI|nr:hypothetical protein AMS68_004457 [Peltaster fructicola]